MSSVPSKKLNILIGLFRTVRVRQIRDLVEMLAIDSTSKVTKDPSDAGEFEAIDTVLKLLEIDSGFCVDIAASNGVSHSSTLPLFRRGWTGLAVELNSRKFSQLAYVYSSFRGVALANVKVTPVNIASLLSAHSIPSEFELLNLDIDSYDLGVLVAMLKNGYRPKVISMEINEKIPPGVAFEVVYHEDLQWREGHFYGCSVTAAHRKLAEQGYKLVGLTFCNALFIPVELGSNLEEMDPCLAYVEGYRDAHGRKELFPWNTNVEAWQSIEPKFLVEEVKNFFADRSGFYSIEEVACPDHADLPIKLKNTQNESK